MVDSVLSVYKILYVSVAPERLGVLPLSLEEKVIETIPLPSFPASPEPPLELLFKKD